MSVNDIGHLLPLRGASDGLFRAECSACEWTWTGEGEAARKNLQAHAELEHPAPIPVRRLAPWLKDIP